MKGKRKRGEGNLFYCFAMLNCFVCFTRTRRCGCWWATSCASWLSEKGPRPRSPSRSARDSPPLSLSLSLSTKSPSLSTAINYINQKPPKIKSISLSLISSFTSITLSLFLCVYIHTYIERLYIYIFGFSL